MEFLACDSGTISVNGSTGEVECSGSWVGVENPTIELVMHELDGTDIGQLLSAALLCFILAAGVRLCMRLYFPR